MSDFSARRTLGRTGLEVSRLCIATSYGVPGDAVERAVGEHGLNFFHLTVMRKYKALAAVRGLLQEGREDRVVALHSYDHSGLLLRSTVHKWLGRLGIDHADVLILGWYNSRPGGRVLDTAQQLQQEGLVRCLGMSGHSRPTFGELARDPASPIDLFMVRYNAAHRGAEQDVFAHLPDENRPGVLTYTATRWGQLLNPKKMPAGERPMTAAECYRFPLTHPAVDSCCIGPKTAAHMDEGLHAIAAGPLSDEEMERVRLIGDHVHG